MHSRSTSDPLVTNLSWLVAAGAALQNARNTADAAGLSSDQLQTLADAAGLVTDVLNTQARRLDGELEPEGMLAAADAAIAEPPAFLLRAPC